MEWTPEVEAQLGKARDKLWAERRDDPNVHGAAIGPRIRKGKTTDELTVTIFVGKKRPPEYISKARLLPRTVTADGMTWGVDVVQGGPFYFFDNAAVSCPTHPAQGAFTGRMRPALQGASISNLNDPAADGVVAGSLGCYVRDNVTDDICILSAEHVIGVMENGHIGDPIIQPGGYDSCPPTAANTIATLHRKVELVDGVTVDAAIARLNDQSAYSEQVAGDLMPPISPQHPAVGIFTAGDDFGMAFLTRMDGACAALNVRPVFAPPPRPGTNATVGVVAPVPGMKIEKVGRTTGYTSMEIMKVGAVITVNYDWDQVDLHDMIFTWFLGTHGDSGSVACVGGDGNTPCDLSYFVNATCLAIDMVSVYYDIPLTQDEDLEDRLRDDFLMQSAVGRLLVSTTYLNTETLDQRLSSRSGNDSQELEQAYAQAYYDKYHDFVADVLTDPSSDALVTQENLDDMYNIYISEGLLGMLTQAEVTALDTIYHEVLANTLGMNRMQIIDYFNQSETYDIVYEALSAVPTIEVAPVLPQPLR